MLGGECFCVQGEGRWFQGRRLGTNAIGGEFCVCLVENVFVCEAKEGDFREGGLVQIPWVEPPPITCRWTGRWETQSTLVLLFQSLVLKEAQRINADTKKRN